MKSFREWRAEVNQEGPRNDVVQELLPRAPGEYSVIAGKPGIGKTMLILELVLCLATGTPFYGLSVAKVKVGYLTFEGGRKQLLDRLETIGRTFPEAGDNLKVEVTHDSWRFETAYGQKKFKEAVGGLDVIVVDPIRYMFPISDPKELAKVVTAFKGILASNGAVGVLAHHLRKRDPRNLIRPENLIDGVDPLWWTP